MESPGGAGGSLKGPHRGKEGGGQGAEEAGLAAPVENNIDAYMYSSHAGTMPIIGIHVGPWIAFPRVQGVPRAGVYGCHLPMPPRTLCTLL